MRSNRPDVLERFTLELARATRDKLAHEIAAYVIAAGRVPDEKFREYRAARELVDELEARGERVSHRYDTTRTSPFGYYVCCECGWVSGQYRATAKEAWLDHVDHARERETGGVA